MGILELAAQARDQLAAIKASLRERDNDPLVTDYRRAASVLVRFNPESLRPIDANGKPTIFKSSSRKPAIGMASTWPDFLADCQPDRSGDRCRSWTLKTELRKAALLSLGTRAHIRAARSANDAPIDDPVQRAFDQLLNDTVRVSPELSREELSALLVASDWLQDVLDDVPKSDKILRLLPIAELLSPIRRLVGRSFVGREDELQRLRDYVGIIPAPSRARAAWRFMQDTIYNFTTRPPLMISGAGGVGKSALLAQFILQHVERAGDHALPFVYLDIDRPGLLPDRPDTLLAEAARQLSIEWPSYAERFHRVMEEVEEALRTYDESESTRLSYDINDVISRFADALKQFMDRPVLLVIDTFEEVQFLGPDAVRILWQMLSDLQVQAPMLRTVIAGRSSIKDEVNLITEVPLDDLSSTDAVVLLLRELMPAVPPSESALEEIVSVVGTNPMSLKLAATIVKKQGLATIKKVDTRSWLILRAKSETVQARLYGRLLTHLHGNRLRALVYPGLVVRRITADVVREVLAEPCGLTLDKKKDLHELIESLSRERAFIESDPADDALIYRQDVRRIMLRALADEVPEATVRAIHNNAVSFYERRSGALARGEELYHRLMRGDPPDILAKRWKPGAEAYLKASLEELPVPAKVWLSPYLGVTPRAELREQAALAQWEQLTATAVQRLLESGDTLSALAQLAEREDRSPSSRLWRLESEANRLAGNTNDAIAVASRGIEAAMHAGEVSTVRMLLRQRALVREGAQQLRRALADIEQALYLEAGNTSDLERLRLLTAQIRLLRKLGSDHDRSRRVTIDQAMAILTPQLLEDLERSPVLLREVVAELGAISDDILVRGLDTVGIELSDAQVKPLTKAFMEWDNHLTSKKGLGPLALEAGLDRSDEKNWLHFVKRLGSRKLANTVIHWRDSNEPARDVDKTIVDLYRQAFEDTLAKPKRQVTRGFRKKVVSRRVSSSRRLV